MATYPEQDTVPRYTWNPFQQAHTSRPGQMPVTTHSNPLQGTPRSPYHQSTQASIPKVVPPLQSFPPGTSPPLDIVGRRILSRLSHIEKALEKKTGQERQVVELFQTMENMSDGIREVAELLMNMNEIISSFKAEKKFARNMVKRAKLEKGSKNRRYSLRSRKKSYTVRRRAISRS